MSNFSINHLFIRQRLLNHNRKKHNLMQSKTVANNRVHGLDFIRIAACYLVILLHVACQGFYSFSDYWRICVAYDSFARMCVPLFFILSGYLLLNGKPLPLSAFYKRRLSRILIPFIIVLAIYFSYKKWTTSEFLYRVISGRVDFHLWFVYSIIGIYFVLPVFQNIFTTKDGKSVAKSYVLLWFISSVCYYTAQRYFGWELNVFATFNFNYFFGYLGYFFIGGLLRDYTFNIKERLVAITVTLVATYLIYRFTISYSLQLNKPNELFFEYITVFVAIQAISFFIAMKDCTKRIARVEFISNHTYWIYLIHVMVLGRVQHLLKLHVDNNTILIIPFISLIVFSVSLIFSIPLMKIEEKISNLLK